MKRAALLLGSATATAVAAVLGAFAFAPLAGCLNDASPVAEAGASGSGGNNNTTPTTDASLGDDDDDAGDATTMLGTGDDDSTPDTGAGDDDATADTGSPIDGQSPLDGGAGGNVAILRVGDGVTALSSNTSVTSAAFVDLYSGAGALIRSVALPSSADAGAHLLTVTSSVTEGYMTLSADKSALFLAAHDVPPGSNLANDGGSVALGRIDMAGALTVQAPVTGLADPTNVRGIATIDGGAAWLSAHDAVYALDTSRAATKVSDLGGAIPREVEIYGATPQLYVSSASSAFLGVGTVGTGTPTTTGTTSTLLPGVTNAATYSFVLFDTDANGTADLLYIAGTDGVEKWTYTAGTTNKWSKVAAATTSLAGTDAGSSAGASGLTGRLSGSTVTLYATSDVASDNHAYKLVDTVSGAVPATISLFAIPLANTAFRGIAFVPGT